MNSWRIVELLGVVADESRYGLLVMLVQAGAEGMSQTRLAARSGLEVPRLKRHIAKLAKAGLVRRNFRRKGVTWKIDERQLSGLVDTITLRLKPQARDRDSATVVIAPPQGFRSLAAKLAAVSAAPQTDPVPASSPPASGRRPRQPEGARRGTARPADGVKSRARPSPAPDSEDVALEARPAPRLSEASEASPCGEREPAGAAKRPAKRRLPARLTDAIAEVSG
ncbi:MAG: winged helix-turn-helix transcriptional regulator [Hyphomicrobiaceae bacterium]